MTRPEIATHSTDAFVSSFLTLSSVSKFTYDPDSLTSFPIFRGRLAIWRGTTSLAYPTMSTTSSSSRQSNASKDATSPLPTTSKRSTETPTNCRRIGLLWKVLISAWSQSSTKARLNPSGKPLPTNSECRCPSWHHGCIRSTRYEICAPTMRGFGTKSWATSQSSPRVIRSGVTCAPITTRCLPFSPF